MTSLPEQIGPYQLVRRLGAGGMGEVLLARDTRLDREVALKLLPRAFARDPEQLARFRREAIAIAAMNHPNIATLYGIEQVEDGTLLLVLEHVEGHSLAERLADGAMSVEEALRVCAQVAEALEVAHERGVIHRDIKPGNVMLGPRGIVKVLDFGLARRGEGLMGLGPRAEPGGTGAEAPAAPVPPAAGPPSAGAEAAPPPAAPPPAGPSSITDSRASGTPGYMSPEQVLQGAQDERTDIFAFGCVLYECLAGRRAFPADDPFTAMAMVLYDVPDLAALPERTPPAVRELIARCLEKQAERRLGDVREARLAIEEALGIRRASALRTGEAVTTPHNLPAETTSFVGREAVLAECTRLLGTARLLTLTGVGGCGKTRLALQLARARLADYADGVWFADLAPLVEAARLPHAVAAALGIKEEAGRPLADSIAAHLASRSTLLVLDNCEHLVSACASLATALLAAAPGLRIVATSREGLAISGETLFAVPTLALPGESEARTAVMAGTFESVGLFVERARAAQPEFELADDNAGTVAEVCRRLDGIPLAIELAAARVRLLSVEQIRARLDDRFRLLTGGSRTALPRHQTLRATIEWSHDHLADLERRLLRRLSAFAGGWTLERAARVCDESGDEFETLDLLTRLVDKSLVVVQRRRPEPRYRFLESVRQFALERLRDAKEVEEVRGRHLDVFLALAEESEGALTGAGQAAWFATHAAEEGNLLTALAWSRESPGDAVKGLRLAAALWRFWSMLGLYEVGRRALDRALERVPAGSEPGLRSRALVRAGGFALYQGDYDAARPLIEQSLALCRELGDRRGEARALSGLGVVAMYQNDMTLAKRSAEDSLALYRAIGQARGEATALHNLGALAWCRGERELAARYYEEALVKLQALGDEGSLAMTLSGLGEISARAGELDLARARFRGAFELIRRLDARREGAYALEAAAVLELEDGRPERAARWLGAADALREAIGSPPVPFEEAERRSLLARIRERLGEESFAMSFAAGRETGFEAAVGEAIESLTAPA